MTNPNPINPAKTSSPFKTPQGLYITKGLFFETCIDKKNVLYSLKDEDHEGYPSLFRLYMEAMDPTEYSFSQKYFYGWEHWKLVCDCEWFKEYISSWRDELRTKIESHLFSLILKTAEAPTKEGLVAARYLLEREYKTSPRAGRPKGGSRARAEADEAHVQKVVQTRLSEDYDRILKGMN